MLVVCCGMVRSGSTLQYNLVNSLLERTENARSHGWIAPLDLDAKSTQLVDWANDGYLHLVKTHVLPHNSAELAATGRVKFCYIYRDIRDVAASAKTKWGYRGDRLVECIQTAIDAFDEVKALEPVLMQRYELVFGNISEAVSELAEFLGLEFSADAYHEIAAANSVENARAAMANQTRKVGTVVRTLLRKYGFDVLQKYCRICTMMRTIGLPETAIARVKSSSIYKGYFQLSHALHPQDPVTLLHPDHISKNSGVAGSWQEYLTASEVERLSERFAGWLRDQSYVAADCELKVS